MPHDDGRIYIRRTDHRRAPSRDGRNWEEDDRRETVVIRRRDDDDDRRETVVIRRRDEEDERREKVAVARRREDERREKRPGAGGPIKRLVVACDGKWVSFLDCKRRGKNVDVAEMQEAGSAGRFGICPG